MWHNYKAFRKLLHKFILLQLSCVFNKSISGISFYRGHLFLQCSLRYEIRWSTTLLSKWRFSRSFSFFFSHSISFFKNLFIRCTFLQDQFFLTTFFQIAFSRDFSRDSYFIDFFSLFLRDNFLFPRINFNFCPRKSYSFLISGFQFLFHFYLPTQSLLMNFRSNSFLKFVFLLTFFRTINSISIKIFILKIIKKTLFCSLRI